MKYRPSNITYNEENIQRWRPFLLKADQPHAPQEGQGIGRNHDEIDAPYPPDRQGSTYGSVHDGATGRGQTVQVVRLGAGILAGNPDTCRLQPHVPVTNNVVAFYRYIRSQLRGCQEQRGFAQYGTSQHEHEGDYDGENLEDFVTCLVELLYGFIRD